MVYVVGMIGLVFGFVFGQMVLYFLLRHRSRAELLNDPSIKWKYGPLNWLIAGATAYSFIALYTKYFVVP